MKAALSLAIVIATLLAGCSTLKEAPKADPLAARIEIMQPTVDISHWPQPTVMVFPVRVDEAILPGSHHLLSRGLHYAVKCNEARTMCRHAIVLPTVKYNLIRSGANTARLDGTFDVAIGRKLTEASKMSGSYTEMTREIPNEVDVIEERTFSFPLKADLQVGRPYTVEGRLGTRITVTLLPKAEILP